MDRRNFLLSFLAAPLAYPLTRGTQSYADPIEIALIADDPQDLECLGPLLDSPHLSRSMNRTFAFDSAHPHRQFLSRILEKRGWRLSDHSGAETHIASEVLSTPATPSFTLTREGRIVDIRAEGLRSLWQSMQASGHTARQLTRLSFSGLSLPSARGRSLTVYNQGRVENELSLERDHELRIQGRQGPMAVRIEEGRVRVTESPCRNQICLSTPPVFQAGDRIVCAPNHVLLEVKGLGGVDTVIG